MVFDVDPYRMIKAKLKGFLTGPREELLSKADVIFGATGKRSVKYEDFETLRSGVYLVSASSQQIEFDVPALLATKTRQNISDSLTLFTIGGKYIILVNNGYPVNFKDASVPMDLMDLVFATSLLALKAVSSRPPGFFVETTLDGEDTILKYWLKIHQGIML